MGIEVATRDYERWLGRHVRLVQADLRRKHERMAEDPFSFLRATFYRWIQISDERLDDLPKGPVVLAVGDLHIENFGTWRDAEGRLVWGINDFDEADSLPFTTDLVRLATSALLARAIGRMRIRPVDICEAILLGYGQGLAAGGKPFVLADEHRWLRDTAINDLRDPVLFWGKLTALARKRAQVPPSARAALRALVPEPAARLRFVPRVAGLGSLGRQRFVALLWLNGGWIAREARALAPSAVQWARRERSRPPNYTKMLERSIRTPDPFVKVRGSWLVRRLAPDCSRIELESLPRRYDEYRLMHAMGWETANVHLGTADSIAGLKQHLRSLGNDWLLWSVRKMIVTVRDDWETFGRAQAKDVKRRARNSE